MAGGDRPLAPHEETQRRPVADRAVIVAERLIQQRELPDGVEPIWIEDVAKGIGFGDRIAALFLALFAPLGVLERACGGRGRMGPDDILTIIFSSGRTGGP